MRLRELDLHELKVIVWLQPAPALAGTRILFLFRQYLFLLFLAAIG